MVVETYGGQVMDTVGIENMIGTPYTEGPELMAQVEAHVNQYKVDIMKGQRAKSIRKNDLIEVELENGAVLKAKTAILTVGAHWRNVNVNPVKKSSARKASPTVRIAMVRCAGKDVAVIGGNSGIEATIDLAGLAKHTYMCSSSCRN